MLSHIRITFYIIYKERSDLQTCRHATYLDVENQAQILYFSKTKQMNDAFEIIISNFLDIDHSNYPYAIYPSNRQVYEINMKQHNTIII